MEIFFWDGKWLEDGMIKTTKPELADHLNKVFRYINEASVYLISTQIPVFTIDRERNLLIDNTRGLHGRFYGDGNSGYDYGEGGTVRAVIDFYQNFEEAQVHGGNPRHLIRMPFSTKKPSDRDASEQGRA